MELREGYKQTEVGIIPEDWEVYEFEKIGIPSNTKINPKISGGGTVCIELEHINQGSGSINETTITTFNSSIKSVFCPNDILFGKLRAYLRKYYLADFKGVCSTEIWVIKPASDEIHFKFLYQIVQSHKFINVSSEAYGTHMPRSDWNIVKKSKFGIPPTKAEQTAIATALSDVDALITQLEKLITKKRHIKQGAMQTLLNPFDDDGAFDSAQGTEPTVVERSRNERRRLKGGWEARALEDVCDVRDGTHDSPRPKAKGVPLITSKNILNNQLNFEDISYISTDDALEINKRSKVHKGDILMSMIGTLGNVALVTSEPNFCIKNVALIKPKKVSPIFLYHWMVGDIFQHTLLDSLDGGIQKFISLGNLRKLNIKVPSSDEQKELAALLTDMDLEITALETKLEKTRKIKQGMMQQLLTGKIRLVDPTPTPKNKQ